MYEVKKRRWVFEGDEKLARENCVRAAQTEDAETLFEAADYLLSQAERGDKNADAVYCMERAAKAGHSQALLAMGRWQNTAGLWAKAKNTRGGGMSRGQSRERGGQGGPQEDEKTAENQVYRSAPHLSGHRGGCVGNSLVSFKTSGSGRGTRAGERPRRSSGRKGHTAEGDGYTGGIQ